MWQSSAELTFAMNTLWVFLQHFIKLVFTRKLHLHFAHISILLGTRVLLRVTTLPQKIVIRFSSCLRKVFFSLCWFVLKLSNCDLYHYQNVDWVRNLLRAQTPSHLSKIHFCVMHIAILHTLKCMCVHRTNGSTSCAVSQIQSQNESNGSYSCENCLKLRQFLPSLTANECSVPRFTSTACKLMEMSVIWKRFINFYICWWDCWHFRILWTLP